MAPVDAVNSPEELRKIPAALLEQPAEPLTVVVTQEPVLGAGAAALRFGQSGVVRDVMAVSVDDVDWRHG